MIQNKEQKQDEYIINQVKDLNKMREILIKQTDDFQKQLDDIQKNLQDQLIKYKHASNPKFIKASEKSLQVLKNFISDQQRIIQNLQKDSQNNVQLIQSQMREAQMKLNSIFQKNNLAVTLAKIQLQSQRIQSLLEEAQQQIEKGKKQMQ